MRELDALIGEGGSFWDLAPTVAERHGLELFDVVGWWNTEHSRLDRLEDRRYEREAAKRRAERAARSRRSA